MAGDAMYSEHETGFWARTPRGARWALIAAGFLLVIGLVMFIQPVVGATLSGGSPWTLIFGPVAGNPPITFFYYLIPAVLIQLAVAFALRSRVTALGVLGAVGAFVIAAFWLFWLGIVTVAGIHWLVTGAWPAGDAQDALGIAVFGVPLALGLLLLNAEAGWLGARDFARRRPASLAR
jgi:hypothetical protein